MYKAVRHEIDHHPIPELRLPAGNGARLLDLGCNRGRWSVRGAEGRRHWRRSELRAPCVARRIFRQFGLKAVSSAPTRATCRSATTALGGLQLLGPAAFQQARRPAALGGARIMNGHSLIRWPTSSGSDRSITACAAVLNSTFSRALLEPGRVGGGVRRGEAHPARPMASSAGACRPATSPRSAAPSDDPASVGGLRRIKGLTLLADSLTSVAVVEVRSGLTARPIRPRAPPPARCAALPRGRRGALSSQRTRTGSRTG